jgi:hypothetical protein
MFRCLAARVAWWLGLALACVVNAAYANAPLYGTYCTSCHGAITPTNTDTCTGCHYHATHPAAIAGGAADVTKFNFAATTDKSTYTVGDTITVSLSGGNKLESTWVRLRLYDANGTMLSDCNRFSAGGCTFATKLTARAQSGMTQLRVGWYGNTISEKPNAVYAPAAGGETRTSTQANHIEEVIATNSFVVNEPAPAPAPAPTPAGTTDDSAGGGGSLDVFVLLAALFGAGRARRR